METAKTLTELLRERGFVHGPSGDNSEHAIFGADGLVGYFTAQAACAHFFPEEAA